MAENFMTGFAEDIGGSISGDLLCSFVPGKNHPVSVHGTNTV